MGALNRFECLINTWWNSTCLCSRRFWNTAKVASSFIQSTRNRPDFSFVISHNYVVHFEIPNTWAGISSKKKNLLLEEIGFFISHNTTCFCCFINLTTCFSICFRPSSGHKIYVIMLEETVQFKSWIQMYKTKLRGETSPLCDTNIIN
jgi:hypothetical protein